MLFRSMAKQLEMARHLKDLIADVVIREETIQMLNGTLDEFAFREAITHALENLFAMRLAGLSEEQRKVAIDIFVDNAISLAEAHPGARKGRRWH